MPVRACQANGQPGFKWGQQGKCYTYRPGDESGRQRARGQAEAQGRAIEAADGVEAAKLKLGVKGENTNEDFDNG